MPPWQILLQRLKRARRWPIPTELPVRQRVALWAALRESDEVVLRRVMEWPRDRDLVIDNLPEKIATAYGDLLFGEDPSWTSATPDDQEWLEEITEPWPNDLKAAEETCVSEGEVWYRLTACSDAGPHPSVEWRSRQDVVPLLHGRNVLAAAFVSQLASIAEAEGSKDVWRHIEIHGKGIVYNALFLGKAAQLGEQKPLTAHPDTADLIEEWPHELDGMLAGRIVNRWGRLPLVGTSVYAGVWTRFLELNEGTTVGKENMRLTAKKRVVVPASALVPPPIYLDDSSTMQAAPSLDGRPPRRTSPRFDAGEDVIAIDTLDVEEGSGDSTPFKVLEYSFDAEALVTYLQHVVETVCQRCDIVPQFIGSGDFGSGNSGTALRVRLLPTINAAEGRGRAWDDELPRVAQMAQLLDALPLVQGGMGNEVWIDAGALPSMERSTALPEDPNETAQRLATLKTADLISIEEGIREQHDDWSDDQVAAELERIRADISSTMPSPTFAGGGNAGGA